MACAKHPSANSNLSDVGVKSSETDGLSLD